MFNVEVYLKDCLDSILQQDIEQEQFEVLLVNDGSTDKSSAICEEYYIISTIHYLTFLKTFRFLD